VVRGSAFEGDGEQFSGSGRTEYKVCVGVDGCSRAYIPTPVEADRQPFLMPIEDVFTISGRGTVVTGRIERGIRQGRRGSRDSWTMRETRKTVATGVEIVPETALMREELETMWEYLLRGTAKEDVEREWFGEARQPYHRTRNSRQRHMYWNGRREW